MNDLLNQDEINEIMNSIDEPTITNPNNLDFICPTCRIPTKRLRVSSPKRQNRIPINKMLNDRDVVIINQPMDLHIKIIGLNELKDQNYVLKHGYCFCFNCEKGWFQ